MFVTFAVAVAKYLTGTAHHAGQSPRQEPEMASHIAISVEDRDREMNGSLGKSVGVVFTFCIKSFSVCACTRVCM